MRGFDTIVIRSVPFVLLLAIGLLGHIGLSKLRKPPERRQNVSLAPLVQTSTVKSGVGQLELEVDGEAIPFRQVTLAAQVAGTIVDKSDRCRAGQFVKSGELLLQIDPQDYDLTIERTQKLIQQTEVNIEELDVERTNTEQLITLAQDDLVLQDREIERVKNLLRQRASSEGALDTARRSRIQAQNALKQLENQLRLLTTRRGRLMSDKDRYHVDLRQAKLDRERCQIVAPMDGVIVSDPVEKDDYVQPGTVLLEIEDTTQIEVRFDLKLDQLRWLWGGSGEFDPFQESARTYSLPNLPVTISMKTESHRYTWAAELARYDGGGLDPRTRTVPCIALVKNPRSGKPADEVVSNEHRQFAPPALMRGMFVKVQLKVPTQLPLIEVPAVALRPGNRVWLVADSKLTMTDASVAQLSDDRALLFSNDSIQPGDQVVVSPLALAIHGMEVRTDGAASETISDSPTTPVAEIDSGTIVDDVDTADNSRDGASR